MLRGLGLDRRGARALGDAERAGRAARRQALHRKRMLAAVLGIVLVGGAVNAFARGNDEFVTALIGSDRSDQARSGGSDGAAPPELPGGGRTILPDRRVVAFYGAPQDDALGALGIGTPAEAAQRLRKQAKPYDRPGRPVLPALELIATIAASSPGSDDLYRSRQKAGVVRRYLDAARDAGALLVLDIQPGRADFISEVRVFEKFLREPDVSLALDPEWAVGPGELPGQTIGSMDASEVNKVAAYLSDIVREGNLPEKLLVVHQFTEDMIRNREQLESHPGVALTLNVDGFGGHEIKVSKYEDFTRATREAGSTGTEGSAGADGSAGAGPYNGFKLFYEEDTDLLSPREVLRLRPDPDLVVYE